MLNKKIESNCILCGKTKKHLIPLALIQSSILKELKLKDQKIDSSSCICSEDLNKLRKSHVESLLKDELGELTKLDEEVVKALANHELLSESLEFSLPAPSTYGEKLSDSLATFGGSWKFIILFAVTMTAWISLNSLALNQRPVDPYPFILLNLILSCLAAIQAPIIMMSQNRQESKDRLRSEQDYRINLKAEIEIKNLHEKVDHLLKHQWERLVEIQQMQLEILNELAQSKTK